MKSLEKIGVLEQDEDKGGRRITQSGQRDLDRKFSTSSFSLSEMGYKKRYLDLEKKGLIPERRLRNVSWMSEGGNCRGLGRHNILC